MSLQDRTQAVPKAAAPPQQDGKLGLALLVIAAAQLMLVLDNPQHDPLREPRRQVGQLDQLIDDQVGFIASRTAIDRPTSDQRGVRTH